MARLKASGVLMSGFGAPALTATPTPARAKSIAFERATGHKVIVSFEAGPSLMQKVTSNAPADLVTHYPEIIDDLIKQGRVVGKRVDFARAGVGIAVKAGAPKPDISTPEAFKRAMLAAKSIAYSRTGASGIIAAKLMERLGLAEQLKTKTKLVDGVPVAEVVAKGEAEIGMQQINVILPVAGADYVGPLPAELQSYVDFAVGVLAVSKERDAARELVKFMLSPEAAPLIRKSGMEPPPPLTHSEPAAALGPGFERSTGVRAPEGLEVTATPSEAFIG
jgi:molybdate transport system substrate-binding protein